MQKKIFIRPFLQKALWLLCFFSFFTVHSTVFLERLGYPAANLTDFCIGYLELEHSIRESKNFKQQLEYLVQHPLVKGIILVINSGGGSATASWEIFEAVRRANLRKPIVSYIDEVCASGAYLTACATSKIVANEMATVGSIGVVRTLEELMPTEFKRDGLKGKVIIHRFKKGKFKQLGSPFDPMSEEDRKQLEDDIHEMYVLFCETVARQRKMPRAAVEAQESLTFTGLKARDLGLIDAIGTLDDALILLQQELMTRGVPAENCADLKERLIWAE